MKLKTLLLKSSEEVTHIFEIVCYEIGSLLGEEVAEELVCVDGILQDYIVYYSNSNCIELEQIDELELLPEYQDKEQELIMQLLYYIYTYAYFISQNRDRIIQNYQHLAYNLFWQIYYMIETDQAEVDNNFYDTCLWHGGTEFLFGERSRLLGFHELKELMFTKKGQKTLETKGKYLYL